MPWERSVGAPRVTCHGTSDHIAAAVLFRAMRGHPDVKIEYCDPWEDAFPMMEGATKQHETRRRVADITDEGKTLDDTPPLNVGSLNPSVARHLRGNSVIRASCRWDDEERYTRALNMMVETGGSHLWQLQST